MGVGKSELAIGSRSTQAATGQPCEGTPRVPTPTPGPSPQGGGGSALRPHAPTSMRGSTSRYTTSVIRLSSTTMAEETKNTPSSSW